jgi:peroxiredoxin
MAISIRNDNNDQNEKTVYQYNLITTGIPNAPMGLPIGIPTYSYAAANVVRVPQPPPLEMPEATLPRALNYYADYGGCGYWRMIWPEYLINGYTKGIISGMTQMILDLRFYGSLKAVRMQRQATDSQVAFVDELQKIKKQMGFRLIYEIDDIALRDDIPMYNRCRDAFTDQKIVDNIMKVMRSVDEVTVTCKFMKEYYQDKTGNKNITVLPNYAPKFWLDKYYNRKKIETNFDKNKKRPRILYAGSGTHIDVLNRTGGKDDFGHVVESIIKARKKFQFVFKGCYPIALKPFIDNGEMEYHNWSSLFDLPEGLDSLNCNAVYAPLVDNIFNKSKSNIKMIESGALGLPGAFQDLCTYEEAPFKFKTGDELIDQLSVITKDFDSYIKHSTNARKYVESMWLEDHINEHEAIYFTDYGSKERNEKAPKLIELNPEQKIN